MTPRKARVSYGLAVAGLITLIVAFIRTAILSTDAWLIAVLWIGGAVMLLVALVLARHWRGSEAEAAPTISS